MVSIASLWIPILCAAVGVFLASSVLHMMLKFWHQADYAGFENEDEVLQAIRRSNPKPGIYSFPYIEMSDMDKPEAREKFGAGAVGLVFLQKAGMPNMGKHLSQWFAYCLLIPFMVAYVAAMALPADASFLDVFRLTGTVAFMAFALGSLQYGIWWGQPWKTVGKDVVDGVIYGLINGACFAFLWPAGAVA